jgi:hypothetical protein
MGTDKFQECIIKYNTCPQPGQAGTKKSLACPGNSKSQIPNSKQWGVKHCFNVSRYVNSFLINSF